MTTPVLNSKLQPTRFEKIAAGAGATSAAAATAALLQAQTHHQEIMQLQKTADASRNVKNIAATKAYKAQQAYNDFKLAQAKKEAENQREQKRSERANALQHQETKNSNRSLRGGGEKTQDQATVSVSSYPSPQPELNSNMSFFLPLGAFFVSIPVFYYLFLNGVGVIARLFRNNSDDVDIMRNNTEVQNIEQMNVSIKDLSNIISNEIVPIRNKLEEVEQRLNRVCSQLNEEDLK